MTHKLSQYQIIGPNGPVGAPGSAYAISDECTRLNDAANPDPDALRVVLYRVERVRRYSAKNKPTEAP